ncbi:adenylate/guanylate cyclase domain-containing protein [Paenibacillus solisilvae]|uniref:Adenylate/guanylate cyclase domain-containing protein n=1 Tax=Paenibacillus solisilvae TaxID=2486751 RepID=A0ABW0VT02_9BACL
MAIQLETVRKIALDHFNRAKRNVIMHKSFQNLAEATDAISDVVPGYEARLMEFGDYIEDNFTVLFIDIRGSTKRAQTIGPANTFMTLHAYFPAVSHVIEYYGGFTMDFAGDGVMAFFGGKNSGVARVYAMQRAGSCGRDLLTVIKQVINPILSENDIPWPLTCGVGIDHGDVIVTKVGTNRTFDVKAFGNCVNTAAKLCDSANDNVLVSKKVKDDWPSTKGGPIRFKSQGDGYVLTRFE